MKDKLDIVKLMAQPYIIEILNELKTPKRFKDLTNICHNERTLSKKLNMLKDIKFIETVPFRDKNEKYINLYRITEKGKTLLKGIEKLRM